VDTAADEITKATRARFGRIDILVKGCARALSAIMTKDLDARFCPFA
jgi:hypothetical protein